MSSSTHVDNKKKDNLILGKGPTQGLGVHSLTAEKNYSINFTVTRKKFWLCFHYNGTNSYLFVNGTDIIKFKVKDYCNSVMPRKLYEGILFRQLEKDRLKWVVLRF